MDKLTTKWSPEREQKKLDLIKEMNEASPERKAELFLKHCPFAAAIHKNRDSVKIKWSK